MPELYSTVIRSCVAPLSLAYALGIFAQSAVAESAVAEKDRGAAPSTANAYFAGGCFWCMEADFEKIDGVDQVVSGFTGGTLANPTYDGKHEGHYEAIKVRYNPDSVSYQQLLQLYWRNVDPFDADGQFCDRGDSYRAAIFYANKQQRALAEASKLTIASEFPSQSVITPILEVTEFWPVKEYHQDYYKKRSLKYNFFRWRCGRDKRLKEIWG
ncbi:MAG: peptide-methionine (S)-S-oxide reductase MsrA [Gammaproteobacteria bacterium]|nr:peptide-methionine (S)-S-oxide reductase MsrA [Gammaproteobacteria bacterium]MBT8150921.1 peptide-methionine (S)-S-oxide reductase MsrA [Gammaproteobacteria bacterium]NNM11198.1 peptide-methionine (S)-S-oxide reductase MsrA [Pseudomonadales bacterium]RZV51720.1 MAG: peptide-methionine (S)-S-oxide reductase [Pseudomonadales bacterium]